MYIYYIKAIGNRETGIVAVQNFEKYKISECKFTLNISFEDNMDSWNEITFRKCYSVTFRFLLCK